jgi:hypothetical protein
MNEKVPNHAAVSQSSMAPISRGEPTMFCRVELAGAVRRVACRPRSVLHGVPEPHCTPNSGLDSVAFSFSHSAVEVHEHVVGVGARVTVPPTSGTQSSIP